ncbi:hypothetical protein CFP56_007827 [Quercus suber]|uniref:Uncharacterized protein n=1 Tax=Quercus suber TaxID=58331 RepID=A0AAW0M8T1_QUESU
MNSLGHVDFRHICTLSRYGISLPVFVSSIYHHKESNDFIVATKLSKYCAYLVDFAPLLLPDYSYTTEIIFDKVVEEARYKLKGSNNSTCQKILTCKDNSVKSVRLNLINHLIGFIP